MNSQVLRIPAICILFLMSLSVPAEPLSTYTSVEPKDCVTIDSAEHYQEPEIDFYQAECPSFGPYRLLVTGGDIRYSIRLRYADIIFPLMELSSFHDLGSKRVEWRYEREKTDANNYRINYKALIYRLNYSTEAGDKQALIVTRLNHEKSCVIGVIEQSDDMNKRARDLADSSETQCLAKEKLHQLPSQNNG